MFQIWLRSVKWWRHNDIEHLAALYTKHFYKTLLNFFYQMPQKHLRIDRKPAERCVIFPNFITNILTAANVWSLAHVISLSRVARRCEEKTCLPCGAGSKSPSVGIQRSRVWISRRPSPVCQQFGSLYIWQFLKFFGRSLEVRDRLLCLDTFPIALYSLSYVLSNCNLALFNDYKE